MSTSPLEGWVRFATSSFDTDDPLDVVACRNVLVNNSAHVADEAAQHRAIWVATNDTYSSANDTHLAWHVESGGSFLDDRWYAFPLVSLYLPRIRADRSSYPVRVSLAGACDATPGGGDQVDFLVSIGAVLTFDETVGVGGSANLQFSGVTSTTPAWLSPDGGSALLDVGDDAVRIAYTQSRNFHTLTDLSGDPASVEAPLFNIRVFGRSTDVATVKPRLYGIEVAEYVGT